MSTLGDLCGKILFIVMRCQSKWAVLWLILIVAWEKVRGGGTRREREREERERGGAETN